LMTMTTCCWTNELKSIIGLFCCGFHDFFCLSCVSLCFLPSSLKGHHEQPPAKFAHFFFDHLVECMVTRKRMHAFPSCVT
jgi:hypothetical protein